MIRVLVRGSVLDESEQHHLRVRRAEPGDMVELRDGAGMVGTGRLTRTGKAWSIEIERVDTAPRPAELVLAVGAGDRDRFGWLAEKAAELGVTTLLPLETERAAGVASKLREEQIERLQRRALEAIKQSGAAWAPSIEAPITLEELATRSADGSRWLADATGHTMPASLDDAAVTFAIGPEGGFTDEERDYLCAQGFLPVVLGSHTLRFETAAVAAAVAATLARRRESCG